MSDILTVIKLLETSERNIVRSMTIQNDALMEKVGDLEKVVTKQNSRVTKIEGEQIKINNRCLIRGETCVLKVEALDELTSTFKVWKWFGEHKPLTIFISLTFVISVQAGVLYAFQNWDLIELVKGIWK